MKPIGYSLSIASGILFSSAAVLTPIPNNSIAIAMESESSSENPTRSEDPPALSLFLDEMAIADSPLESKFLSAELFLFEVEKREGKKAYQYASGCAFGAVQPMTAM
ncbi:MAG: hypothetical protein J7647_03720 [Cyanobacteria bacterium SBLK]|nr:hypothetical protein [Cyanobacteria bacterium SBLK]